MTGPFGHGKVSIPSKAGEWSLLCISDMYLELAVQSCVALHPYLPRLSCDLWTCGRVSSVRRKSETFEAGSTSRRIRRGWRVREGGLAVIEVAREQPHEMPFTPYAERAALVTLHRMSGL